MTTIDILGDEETFKNIVERTITEIEDNEVESIGGTAFLGCNSLTSASFLVVTSIGDVAFHSCSNLTSVSFPVVTDIAKKAFFSCNKLTTMYIGTESNTVCTLGVDAIPSSVTDIYVPEALVDLYKTANNWSSFADKIKAYTGV